MQYKEKRQQQLREESVLKALQQANESGKNCSYSEEQILEAQRQSGKMQVNYIYSELINPVSNGIINIAYILTTLILMPILYSNKEGSRVAAVTAYVLLFIVLIVLRVVERSVKKDTEKQRKWIIYINKFSNDTFVFGYIATSLGYLMVILDFEWFWFIYVLIVLFFLSAIFRDFVEPFLVYLRQHFGNRKSVS